MYRTTPVIASLRSKRGNLPNTTEVFVNERLPRRFAPRNDVVMGWQAATIPSVCNTDNHRTLHEMAAGPARRPALQIGI